MAAGLLLDDLVVVKISSSMETLLCLLIDSFSQRTKTSNLVESKTIRKGSIDSTNGVLVRRLHSTWTTRF